jgi:hypothetical protein
LPEAINAAYWALMSIGIQESREAADGQAL